MKPLSKGDTCKVRLHTGEVVEAVYDSPSRVKKDHFVRVGHERKLYRATSFPDQNYSVPKCRFVGPSCDLVPVGVRV